MPSLVRVPALARLLLACSFGAACPAADDAQRPDAAIANDVDAGLADAAVPPVPTHVGLVSIQDVSIVGRPEVGHGLSVVAAFTPARAPDYEETPGLPTGCKGWVYDLDAAPPPSAANEGTLSITG